MFLFTKTVIKSDLQQILLLMYFFFLQNYYLYFYIAYIMHKLDY